MSKIQNEENKRLADSEARKADWKKWGTYLRHTAATLMLKQGIHPKVVQERLGYSDISLALATYSPLHLLCSRKQRL
ncbi:MAG: tyrosine-type recombinase/integrase [Gammaproteobacteria bacterium]|nr:tyrosine-type recombinase/integrase [Gammaproteobacteria bacterium]